MKPARSHHCTVCGQCFFLMDHHCPWINNCVGLENRKYFLLFCFYLMLGCAYNLLTFQMIRHSYVYTEQRKTLSFAQVLNVLLLLIMIGFTGWNGWMAVKGTNSVELSQQACYDFRFKSWIDNLFVVFGTTSLVRILSPSLRSVPFTGIEWAFLMQELGFDQGGNPLVEMV